VPSCSCGVMDWAGSQKHQTELLDLSAVLRCLPMTDELWECSFRLARICRAKTTPIPSSDLLIASSAFIYGGKKVLSE